MTEEELNNAFTVKNFKEKLDNSGFNNFNEAVCISALAFSILGMYLIQANINNTSLESPQAAMLGIIFIVLYLIATVSFLASEIMRGLGVLIAIATIIFIAVF